MDKIKKWFKNNKKKSIIISIVVIATILLIIFTISVISFLMPNTRKSVYGDRCEITKKNPVEKDRKSKISDFLKDYKGMDISTFEVKCNLIDVVVKVDDSTSISKVKKMGKKMLGVFSKDELKYYDIQLIVYSNKESSEAYPIIGTHHKEINGNSNDDFVW